MIASFKHKATQNLYHGRQTKVTRKFPEDIIRSSLRKLDILNAASSIRDLRSPPVNRLESLKGDSRGFYSIRVNDQWRIIFRWQDKSVYDVELIDYHD